LKQAKELILHPFLFAAYPVLALLAHNLGESRLSVGIRALVVSILIAVFLLVLFYVFYRNWFKAAILCTIALMLIFSYGQIYNLIEGASLYGINLGRHRILLPLYVGIFFVGIWLITKKIQNLTQVTEILNIIGFVAVAIPIFQIVVFQMNTNNLWGENSNSANNNPEVFTNSGVDALPDVYYIVLDAYARGDTMKDFYGFDNQSFLGQLEEMGFYIAGCSQSNYAKTRLSLASTLNMNYLEAFDKIAGDLARGRESRIRMGQLIRRNAVRKKFQDLGYTIVAFETGYLWSEWDKSDIYLSQFSDSSFENIQLFRQINDFEALLIRTSIGSFFMDAETEFSSVYTPIVTSSPRQAHFDYILYTLDTLESVPSINSPKFVFAHLISPHGPYVFDADGNFIPENNDSEQGYINQVKYLNTRFITILQSIIENSDPDPIIIVQGDHGGHGTQFDPENRMNILNAYYLPDTGTGQLYESISPVNTFRLVFDQYFAIEYDLLPDVSYYSSVEDYFDFEIVPNRCNLE